MSVDKLFQKALSKHQKLLFAEAADLYRKFLKSNPDHLDANYLLGTLYAQRNNLGEAERYLKRAEEIHPGSPMVKVNLGNLYKALGKYDLAVECFTLAIQIKPDLAQAYFGLGSVLEIIGEDEQKASDCYFTALSLDQSIPEVHQAVGRIHFKFGRPESLDHLETAKRLNPSLPGIYRDLGIVCLRYEKTREAAEYLAIAESQTPDDDAVRYFLAVAQGREPDPELKERYVREEFDRFAQTFDSRLVDSLKYDAPAQLLDLVREQYGNGITFHSAVDIGCGTGLSGMAFRECVDVLTGIDISEKMLEAAESRNCYDRLLQGNSVEILNGIDATFDLFIAADVFVYIGDLGPMFEAVRAKASSGAMMVFSTENSDTDGIVLKTTGRYAHSPRYIDTLSVQHSFEVVSRKAIRLRTEGPNWIMGDIYLLKLMERQIT